MIYHNKVTEELPDFEALLEATKVSVIEKLRYIERPASLSGNDFELLTFEEMNKCAIGTGFEGSLVHTSDREFPDIVAKGFLGVEVKATIKDVWVSIGNSVLESSRVATIDKIYIFFGKLGGNPDIEYRNYEDCMRGIAVTHYPRYQIDMHLLEGESIFDRMGVNYDVMRKSKNPVSHVRKYYKSQMTAGDALWWIDDDIGDTPILSPVIKNFSSLCTAERDDIKAELFILYPEVFSRSSNKYKRIPAYLASRYGVVCSNVRDIFTAGGQISLTSTEGKKHKVPQIVGELVRLAPLIEKRLSSTSMTELANSWERHVGDYGNAQSEWFYELNKQSSGLDLSAKLSSFYEQALKR